MRRRATVNVNYFGRHTHDSIPDRWLIHRSVGAYFWTFPNIIQQPEVIIKSKVTVKVGPWIKLGRQRTTRWRRLLLHFFYSTTTWATQLWPPWDTHKVNKLSLGLAQSAVEEWIHKCAWLADERNKMKESCQLPINSHQLTLGRTERKKGVSHFTA